MWRVMLLFVISAALTLVSAQAPRVVLPGAPHVEVRIETGEAPVAGVDLELLRRIVVEEWAAYWRERGETPGDLEALRLEAVLSRLLLAHARAGQADPWALAAPPAMPSPRPIIVLPGQTVLQAPPPAAAPVAGVADVPAEAVEVPAEAAEVPAEAVDVPAERPAAQPVVLPPVSPGPLPLPPAQLDRPATRVEIERTLLETGLFRAMHVLFEFDSSRLLPASAYALDAIGEIMVRHPGLRIAVHGHTDGIGSAAYNQALSERRAEAVRQYLLESFPEIAPERIEARGFGLEQPIASNATESGRALNRRVEFVVLEAGEPVLEADVVHREVSLDEMLRRRLREERVPPRAVE